MRDVNQRMTDIEVAVSHLEHELGQMHSVLLAVQRELKQSREQVAKLERRLTIAIDTQEERDPMDERPPHY